MISGSFLSRRSLFKGSQTQAREEKQLFLLLTLSRKVRLWQDGAKVPLHNLLAGRPAAVYFPVGMNTQLVVCFSCVVIAAWKENVGVVKK